MLESNTEVAPEWFGLVVWDCNLLFLRVDSSCPPPPPPAPPKHQSKSRTAGVERGTEHTATKGCPSLHFANTWLQNRWVDSKHTFVCVCAYQNMRPPPKKKEVHLSFWFHLNTQGVHHFEKHSSVTALWFAFKPIDLKIGCPTHKSLHVGGLQPT